MPEGFAQLAGLIGVPGAMLALALGVTWRLYSKAIADKDAAHLKTLDGRDATIKKLEERNDRLEAKLIDVLEKGDRVLDDAGAPRLPAAAPTRRRRQEV